MKNKSFQSEEEQKQLREEFEEKSKQVSKLFEQNPPHLIEEMEKLGFVWMEDDDNEKETEEEKDAIPENSHQQKLIDYFEGKIEFSSYLIPLFDSEKNGENFPLFRRYFKQGNIPLKQLLLLGLKENPTDLDLLIDLSFFHEYSPILQELINAYLIACDREENPENFLALIDAFYTNTAPDEFEPFAALSERYDPASEKGKILQIWHKTVLEKKDEIVDINSSEFAKKDSYSSSVQQLLTLGKPDWKEWQSYAPLGIGQDQIPDLIRMATDLELHDAKSDSLEVWAPVHAWRALGELRAEAAISPLIQLFDELEESDDWAYEELPVVLGKIGPVAIPPLTRYLMQETENDFIVRHLAAGSLKEIADHFPESRLVCIEAISNALKQFQENDPGFNGLLIADLMHLKGVEVISAIEQAFQLNCVDESIPGDFEDVEIELGLKTVRQTPRKPFRNSSLEPFKKTIVEAFEKLKSSVTKSGPKIGRNDPCPCGSGKKFKKCCLNEPSLH